MCEQMVKSFMTARTVEQQNEYLGKLELTQRFSTTGSSAPATGFRNEWWLAYKLFLHYPVHKIQTNSREDFLSGKYTTELAPLYPFEESGVTFTTFLDGAFAIADIPALREKESRLHVWARQQDGSNIELCEPPFPVVNGVQRPHGAVLDFAKRPPHLVYSAALVRYLRCRGMRVRSDHPRETKQVPVYAGHDNHELREITYERKGLIQLVKESLEKGCDAGLITLEEETVAGEEDPTPWEYVTPEPWTLLDDFKEVTRVCKQCGFTNETVNQWFGINNANRLRAQKLFRNAHIDWTTFQVREARMLASGDKAYLFQAAITASQRVRSYCTLLAYNVVTKKILGHPSSSCECVVQMGPGCSHQLATACAVILFVAMSASGVRSATEAMSILPSHVGALQRVAMTIEYAYGFETISRRDVLKHVVLPRATRARLSAKTSKQCRDVPIPMVEWVQKQLLLWRAKSSGTHKANDLRIKKIREDTDREISYLPRSDEQQLFADSMRERLYNAYLRKHIGGWDDDVPTLMLYYLVHSRTERVVRIRGRSGPLSVHVPSGCKRCVECGHAVPGGKAVCPECDTPFPKRRRPEHPPMMMSINQNRGVIKTLMELYPKLPGRWIARAWSKGVTERLRVRRMGAEGMIGEYCERLHEEGALVQVIICMTTSHP
jgi:hypothetical protein